VCAAAAVALVIYERRNPQSMYILKNEELMLDVEMDQLYFSVCSRNST